MLVGYARVSRYERNLDEQLNILRAAGCEKIFWDQASSRTTRLDGLALALKQASDNDTLMVRSLDRVGSAMKPLLDIASSVEERSITFRSLVEKIDTSTSSGMLVFVLAVTMAEREYAYALARKQLSPRRSNCGGRKPVMTVSMTHLAKSLIAQGLSRKQVASEIGVCVQTLRKSI